MIVTRIKSHAINSVDSMTEKRQRSKAMNVFHSMTEILLIIAVILIGFQPLKSQNTLKSLPDSIAKLPLIAYQKDSLWHFLDHTGKEMFTPKSLVSVEGYSEGLIRVKFKKNHEEKWGFMNLEGKIIFSVNCDYVFDFHEGMAITENTDPYDTKKNTFGYIDKTGKQVIPNINVETNNFSEGLAFVYNKDKQGYIDNKGNWKIRIDGYWGNQFHEGYAAFGNDTIIGFIDKSGKVVLPLKYDEVGDFSEGLCPVYVDIGFKYINKKGEIVIDSSFQDAKNFNCGYAVIGRMDKAHNPRYTVIDKNGRKLEDYVYNKLDDFSEGFAAARKEDASGFVDSTGRFAFPPLYTFTANYKFGMGYASQWLNGVFGYIDYYGDYVLKIPKFDVAVDLRLNCRVY